LVVTFGAWALVAPRAAALAGAAEVSVPNLALKKTYLKSAQEADAVSLSGAKLVFSPTSVMCPGSEGSCTARITLSVELFTFDPPNGGEPGRVVCHVARSGVILPTQPVFPGLVAHYFGDASGDFQANVLTFSWVARNLPLGATTFNVICATVVSPTSVGGPVTAGARTLTIDVYKP
jgi:hypothetical protein